MCSSKQYLNYIFLPHFKEIFFFSRPTPIWSFLLSLIQVFKCFARSKRTSHLPGNSKYSSLHSQTLLFLGGGVKVEHFHWQFCSLACWLLTTCIWTCTCIQLLIAKIIFNSLVIFFFQLRKVGSVLPCQLQTRPAMALRYSVTRILVCKAHYPHPQESGKCHPLNQW